MLETIHILPVRAESVAPASCAAKSSTSAPCCKSSAKVDWKKAGLIAGGVTVVRRSRHSEPVQILSGHRRARAQKKQLAPLNDKLDALQAENRMLRAELEKKNAPSEEQN